MKKFLSIVLAAIMCLSALSMVSCDTSNDGKYEVGICQLVQHPALDQATKGFVDALKETGFDGVFSLEIDGAIFRAAAVYPELMFDYVKIAYKIARKLVGGAV